LNDEEGQDNFGAISGMLTFLMEKFYSFQSDETKDYQQ